MSRDALGWSPEDYAALVATSHNLGVSPIWLAQVLYSESGMNPRSLNSIGYRGINQIGYQELQHMGLSDAQIAAFTTWTPAQQLKYVERYFRIWLPRSGYISRAQLYQANFLPSTVASRGSDPSVVLARAPSPIFKANAALSTDGRQITVGDLDTRIESRINEPNTRWPVALTGISDASGITAMTPVADNGLVRTSVTSSATDSVLVPMVAGAAFLVGAIYILNKG